MGYIEELDRAGGTHYRAVPWLAGPPGIRGKRGKSRVFGPGERDQAEKYIVGQERNDDTEWGEYGAPARRNRKKVKFAVYVVTVASTMGDAWATRRNYRSMGNELAKVWPDAYVDEITSTDVAVYMSGLIEAGRSPSLRAKRRTVLVQTFAAAVRDGLIAESPAEHVRPVRQRKKGRKRPITEDEAARLHDALPTWLRPALWVSYDCGARVGEICGLRWSYVDLDRGTVTIGPVMQANGASKPFPKNGEECTVPLSDRALAALLRHRAAAGKVKSSDYVFREPRDGVLWRFTNPDRVKNVWAKARTDAGITDGTLPRWHDLRHHTAQALVEAGNPIHVVQAIMRHLDLASTQVYMPEVGPDQMRAAMTRAGAGHLPPRPPLVAV